jgi:radical SAM protein with 4Fe4S-binding SPASM domain
LRTLGINTKIITHGGNLRPHTIRQMQELGIAGVGISVDGLEKTHDYVRGREGLFRKVATSIDRVLAADLPLTVITAVNGVNVNELPELFGMLRRAGVYRWQIQPVFHLGRIHESSELELTDRTYMKLGSFVREYVPVAETVGLEILLSDSFGYFTDFDTRAAPWHGCQAGLVSCGITSDGKIKGCLSLPDELIEGDLRERDLWDIWFDPESFTYTRGFALADLGPSCGWCDKGEKCRGGCSAMSYGATQRFHNDPFCFYRIKRQARMCGMQGS